MKDRFPEMPKEQLIQIVQGKRLAPNTMLVGSATFGITTAVCTYVVNHHPFEIGEIGTMLGILWALIIIDARENHLRCKALLELLRKENLFP